MSLSHFRKFSIQLATAGVVALISGQAFAETVSSSIEGSNCIRKYNSFVVPNGRTAANFKVLDLRSGRTCMTNQPIANKGFSIRDNNYNTIFSSSGGNLGALRLAPGTYSVVVDGGNGAHVTLSYTIQ